MLTFHVFIQLTMKGNFCKIGEEQLKIFLLFLFIQ